MADPTPCSETGESLPVARELPDRIGDYRIIAEIGRGGMGVVYQAVQESLNRSVALKVLPDNLPSDKARRRFQREARAAAGMHHTNIVPVFEVGHDAGRIFYAMQLIDGRSLDNVIDELRESDSPQGSLLEPLAPFDHSSQMSSADGLCQSSTKLSRADLNSSSGGYYQSVARIVVQVADALAFAHERNVIHRDIKPSNLMLDKNGVIWITDFGLAKTDEDEATLTRSDDVLGTLRYMSP